MNGYFIKGLTHARRWITAIIGFTVLAIGVTMIVLPGPAFFIIPAGMGILATEFIWARRLLQAVKSRFQKTTEGGKINEAE